MNNDISRAQGLQFELMKVATFNGFDGDRVVDDLMSHRDLWEGAVMNRLNDLIYLRDIGQGLWNVDTLYIIPQGGKEKELKQLAEGWEADEIYCISEEKAAGLMGCIPHKKILGVWWD